MKPTLKHGVINLKSGKKWWAIESSKQMNKYDISIISSLKLPSW